MKKALHAVTSAIVEKSIEAEDSGRHLAELIEARIAMVKGEADRRKDYKDLLATYDCDIARLAGTITSGQLPLFDKPSDDEDE